MLNFNKVHLWGIPLGTISIYAMVTYLIVHIANGDAAIFLLIIFYLYGSLMLIPLTIYEMLEVAEKC